MKHPHNIMHLMHWCRVCSVTERQLFLAPRDSVLWQECYVGVVGDYNELTTGHWYEEIH